MLANPAWVQAAGRFIFRYRNAVFPLVLLSLIVVFPPQPAGGSAAGDRMLDAFGALLLLCGQGLRVAVIGYAYIRRGGVNKQVYADDLVTQGFFAVCRNPLYVGNLLIYGGLLVIHHNPWSYLLGGAFFLFAYRAIVAAEEAFLGEKFGPAYAEYAARTPRWLPRWSRLPAATAGMEFNWARVIVKDYTTAAPWMLALLVLLIRERLSFGTTPLSGGEWTMAAAAASTIAVLWLTARWLKKSGRLKG
ncbi:MAG: hypothetical protein DI587_36170 [Variovorax paradoxus]|nr:MAG: hypothetical protein DI583_36170 [Variovorax paradoxus]PZQ00839.1 MAG: hypothetical protein DI587_36170 [Variovorax paradoxus]